MLSLIPKKELMRKLRERRRAARACQNCGKPAIPGMQQCVDHRVKQRERDREKAGAKTRILSAVSYRAEFLKNQGHSL